MSDEPRRSLMEEFVVFISVSVFAGLALRVDWKPGEESPWSFSGAAE